MTIKRSKIKSIKQINNFKDEYVYDIGMKNENHPWFFGNNILLHNSVYFSAAPTLKQSPEYKDFSWDKNNVISLYDMIGEEVNSSFKDFMMANFNCSDERAKIIAAGREIVGSRGLFIKKKRYAILVYDKEGERMDENGKSGEIKAMGLDTKRTDTPKRIQDFLTHVLQLTLEGKSEQAVLDYISDFREEFRDWNSWEKGSPKGVHGLTEYNNKEQKANGGKINMPGHVRAALNWNKLRKVYQDHYSLEIMDGNKIIVCKLKNNPMKMTSIAYPVDQSRLPNWFKELPFDDAAMEEAMIDKKLENIVGVLKWDLNSTKDLNSFNDLFARK